MFSFSQAGSAAGWLGSIGYWVRQQCFQSCFTTFPPPKTSIFSSVKWGLSQDMPQSISGRLSELLPEANAEATVTITPLWLFFFWTKSTSTRKPFSLDRCLHLRQPILWAPWQNILLNRVVAVGIRRHGYHLFTLSAQIRARLLLGAAVSFSYLPFTALHRGEAGWERSNSKGHPRVSLALPSRTDLTLAAWLEHVSFYLA